MSEREFIDGYIEAALWASTDDDGQPLDDNYDSNNISDETIERMEADARDFYCANYGLLIEHDDDVNGHNFWLTRNGHGAGFWDGDYPEHGDELTDSSKAFGEYDLYAGDDDQLYGYPP